MSAISHRKDIMKKATKNSLYYSMGFMSQNIIWYMINTYLMLFYTDVVSLSAGAISTIMLVARVWDAVNDPMMGVIVDKTKSKWGKFRPYIIIAPPFLAIFDILTFTVWPVEGVMKAVLCGVSYILAGMAYTAVGVAINGIVNRLSTDSNEKMKIISIANVASNVLQTVFAAVAMPMILFFSKSDTANGRGFLWTTVILALVSVPLFLICGFKCKEIEIIEPVKKENKGSFAKDLKLMLKNKPLVISISTVFIGAIGAMARMSLLTYYVIYVVGSYTMISAVFTTLTVCQIIGTATLPWGTKKFGKKGYMIILLIINAASDLVLFFNGHPTIAFVLGVSVIGGFSQGVGAISYGMMCDSIDYGDYKFGVRNEGISSSLMSFSVKLASAITGSLSIWLLAAAGYVAGEQQSASAMTGINVIVNLIPAILQLVGIIPLIWYKLDSKKMDEVAIALKERNEGMK